MTAMPRKSSSSSDSHSIIERSSNTDDFSIDTADLEITDSEEEEERREKRMRAKRAMLQQLPLKLAWLLVSLRQQAQE